MSNHKEKWRQRRKTIARIERTLARIASDKQTERIDFKKFEGSNDRQQEGS